jgi:hypothetical protein
MAKFTITMKDPDYSTDGADTRNLTRAERAWMQSFIEWDEYVTIEFDTTAKTARVVPVQKG